MLLWKFLQKQQHGLLQVHIKKIAGMCNGFSGHDIKKLVDKASMWPSQKVMEAKYFSREKNPFLCLKKDCQSYHPCHQNGSGAEAITIDHILDNLSEDPCVPIITYDDMIQAIKETPKTVKAEDLKNMSKFSLDMNRPLRQSPMSMQKPAVEPEISHQKEIEILWQMKFVLLNSADLSRRQIFWRKQKFKVFKIQSNALAKAQIKKVKERDGETLEACMIKWTKDFNDSEKMTHSGAEHMKIHLSVHDVVKKICRDKSLQSFEFDLN